MTYRQLRKAGLSRRQIAYADDIGHLHREHHGVYAVGHQAPSDLGRWMSAVLACGPGAALSHRSAATLHGIRNGQGPKPDVTAPKRRDRPGIATHVGTPATVIRRNVPVTTVAETIAALAHVLDDDELPRLIREAQYRRVFNLRETQAAAARRPSRPLKALLEDMTVTSSELDAAFIALIRRHGIVEPTGQRLLLGHRVDYVWERQRVAVELDSYSAHVSLDAFQRDRTQGNALQLAGWIVLRFTFNDVHRNRRRTIGELRRALG